MLGVLAHLAVEATTVVVLVGNDARFAQACLEIEPPLALTEQVALHMLLPRFGS